MLVLRNQKISETASILYLKTGGETALLIPSEKFFRSFPPVFIGIFENHQNFFENFLNFL